MDLFSRKRGLSGVERQIYALDSEIRYLRRSREADRQEIERLSEQIACLKVRTSLCEVILANLLAKNVNCIIGWDFYLEKLREIRSSDPDSDPDRH